MALQNSLPNNDLGDSVRQYGARPFNSFTSSEFANPLLNTRSSVHSPLTISQRGSPKNPRRFMQFSRKSDDRQKMWGVTRGGRNCRRRMPSGGDSSDCSIVTCKSNPCNEMMRGTLPRTGCNDYSIVTYNLNPCNEMTQGILSQTGRSDYSIVTCKSNHSQEITRSSQFRLFHRRTQLPLL